MKRNLLALFAVVAAIGFSAFTTKHTTVKSSKFDPASEYFQFKTGVTDETDFNNYQSIGTSLPSDCFGSATLCWMKVIDLTRPGGGAPDGLITIEDFQATFANLDTNHNGSLDDESEDNVNISLKL